MVNEDSVMFDTVVKDDGGTYICRAESSEGSAEETIRFLIEGENLLARGRWSEEGRRGIFNWTLLL